MAQSSLRVYYGPESEVVSTVEPQPSDNSVSIPLAEILPALADAVSQGRTWVNDFADDEITISADLYDMILAYQHFTRPTG
jgi:hypothetical protein